MQAMHLIAILRIVEVMVAAATTSLAAVGHWEAGLMALPGIVGLLIATHYYKMRFRGQRSGEPE